MPQLNNQRKLLKKEVFATGILIIIGLLFAVALSLTSWGCNIDTVGGCEPVSKFEESLFLLISVVSFTVIIIMPLIILITTIYSLILLRKLEK